MLDTTSPAMLTSIPPSSALAVIRAGVGLPTCTPPDEASVYASRLLGFYPAREVNDPKAFSSGMTALLSAYPVDLVRRVCDPVTGLPSRLKFLPTLAEVKEALEAELARRKRITANAQWVVSEAEKRAAEAREAVDFERNRPPAEVRKAQAEKLISSIRLNNIGAAYWLV